MNSQVQLHVCATYSATITTDIQYISLRCETL